jgi:hypothetical protein
MHFTFTTALLSVVGLVQAGVICSGPTFEAPSGSVNKLVGLLEDELIGITSGGGKRIIRQTNNQIAGPVLCNTIGTPTCSACLQCMVNGINGAGDVVTVGYISSTDSTPEDLGVREPP